MLSGQQVTLQDAFCKCPDWATWLKVYSSLLTGKYYGPALQYGGDPFLYGYHVWQSGWATDPKYLVGTGAWMSRLFDLYSDTLLGAAAAPSVQPIQVPIKDTSGKTLCVGWLEGDRTVAPVRQLAEALGLTVRWDESTQSVTLAR